MAPEPVSSAGRSDSAPEAGGRPWSHVAATLRAPYFTPLLLSNLLQFSSNFAQVVVLQWLVTSLTDSRAVIGLVGFVQGAVIFVTSPVAGVAVDRFAKRTILMVGRIGLTGVILAIAALIALERIQIWHILVSAFVTGLLMSVTQPATQTFVFDLVGRERVQNAVGLNAAATSVGQTVGPVLGGVLVGAIGLVGAYLSSAAGFLLAAAMLLLVRVPGRAADGQQRSAWGKDLREGLSYVLSHRPVLLALIACSMAVFNGALNPMRPVFARHVLHVSSAGYGTMAGTAGLGAMVMALAVASLPTARRPGLLIVVSLLGFAVTLFLYSFAFSYRYILVIEFINGAFGQLWAVSTFSGLQMAVPEEMRGRVVSLVFMLVMLAPAGQLVVGLLADAFGDQLALGLFGLIPTVVLTGILILGYRSLREL